MNGAQLARAATGLIGAPFRLHGRDPATGLDCIGVLAASLKACGKATDLPSGYALRNRALPRLDRFIAGCGLEPVSGTREQGDVLLVCPGPGQFHLAIAADDDRFVHAHASIRRVILGHIPAHWRVIGHWRLRAEN
jgi:cell wall-associated NlpC family hydrolase